MTLVCLLAIAGSNRFLGFGKLPSTHPESQQQGKGLVAKPLVRPSSSSEGSPWSATEEIKELVLPVRTPSPSWKDHRKLNDPGNTRALIEATGGTPHFLTTLSGCRMARWLVPIQGPRPYRRDCYQEILLSEKDSSLPPRVLTNETIQLLQPQDTIYLTFEQVEDFCQDLLPLVTVDVVLLTGQRENLRPPQPWAVQALFHHPHVILWYCQNLPQYAAAIHPSSWNHPPPLPKKLAPFPFGIKQLVTDDPLEPTNRDYPTVFWEALTNTTSRSTTVFAGYLNQASNLRLRADLPMEEAFLPPLAYYRKIAQATYVLSPNGDRPECYRHYEALGLGTAPLTHLDPLYFGHLQNTGLVFACDHIENDDNHLPPHPIVLRNAVLEEYWMEHMDWVAQRSLTWWNRYRPPQGPTTVATLLQDLT